MNRFGFLALFSFIFITSIAFSSTNISLVNLVEIESFFNSPTDRGLYVYLNENIGVNWVKKHIRFRPSVGFFNVKSEYKAKKHCYKITGNFKANKSYNLELIPGQIGTGKQHFAESKVKFTAKGAESKVEFITNNSVVELKSKQLLPISYTNIGDFRLEITKLPAFIAPTLENFYIFSDADEERPNSTHNIKNKRDSLKPQSLSNELLEEVLKEAKKLQGQLKSDDFSEISEELKLFLKGNFSKTRKGYLGSEGIETEQFFSLPLDVREQPKKGGSYILSLKGSSSTNEAVAEEFKFLQITDLSITYKFSASQLLLWVTSMETGRPVKDAEILLTTVKNRYGFPGKTDKDGLIVVKRSDPTKQLSYDKGDLKYVQGPLPIHEIIAISAATEDDSSFISLTSNRLYPNNLTQVAIDKGAIKQNASQVFCERGVYRPGETVYWKAIFREQADGEVKVPSNSSIEVLVKNSRDEEIYNENHQLNEFGSYSGSFELSKFAYMGEYRIEAWLKGKETEENETNAKWDRLMGRTPKAKEDSDKKKIKVEEPAKIAESFCGFQVQEFEPPRHFVDIVIKPEQKTVMHMVGQEKTLNYAKCRINGNYYAGGSLKHAKVQWSANLVGHKSSMANYDEYLFGNEDGEKVLIESGNSILNKDGYLELEIPLNQSVANGLNALEIIATVIDIDGKAATGINKFTMDTSFKVGISNVLGPDPDQQSQIKVVALDRNGNKINGGKFNLDLMFNRWFYTRKRASDGSVYYSWSQGWLRSSLLTQESVGGEATFKLSLLPHENYMVKVTYENGEHSTSSAKEIRLPGSYGSYRDYNNKLRSNSGNHLVLISNKNKAKVTDRVNIKYSLPYAASYGLIACENDEILNYRVIRLDKSYGNFTETMVKGCDPDVYISLTVPTLRNDFPTYSGEMDNNYPRTCYGYTKISVKAGESDLKLKIEPDKKQDLKGKPGEDIKLEFRVKSEANPTEPVELAVCVVDESILALTGFRTPQIGILQHFIKPLSVFSGDLRVSLIGQNLSKLIQTKALTGGGEGTGDINSEDALRKDFRPVAYWNGALKTDENGTLTIEFKAPDSMTKYRVYAVANNKSSGFVSAERTLEISKEFYVEPGVPTFLTKGDVAHISIGVHNLTSKAGKAKLEIEKVENLTASLRDEEIEIKGKDTEVVKATIIADSDMEEGSLRVGGKFEGLRDRVERSLPINKEHIMISRQISGAFTKNVDIKAELPPWIDSDELKDDVKGRITVSTGLWSRLTPGLKYLINYPYGCTEQISSRLMPLAALRTISSEEGLLGYTPKDYDEFIEKGLENLYKLQLGTGGFAFWPSMNNESWWSTQYAVLALSLLQKSGYEVDKERLDRALKYVKTNLFKGRKTYYEEGIYALSLVNLAIHKQISNADLQTLRKGFDDKNEEVKILLTWAEFLNGEIPYDAMAAIIGKLTPSKETISKSWYFSTVRLDAFKLLVSLCEDSKNSRKVSSNLAGSLIERLNSNGYYTSTADTGIGLFALSEYIKTTEKELEAKAGNVTLVDLEGNKEYEIDHIGKEIVLTKEQLINGFELVSSNKGLIHWSLNYEYPAKNEEDKDKEENAVSEGFIIYKSIENISGEKTIKVGDIIKVNLTFEDKFAEGSGWYRLGNIALEDHIPAGFTPINTALKNDVLPSDISEEEERYYYENSDGSYGFYPSYSEIKKDKFLAFKNRGWSGRFRVSYYLRASCPGVYKVKPAQISLMYEPEFYGRSNASSITIEE